MGPCLSTPGSASGAGVSRGGSDDVGTTGTTAAAADVLVDPAYVPKFTPFTEEDAAWLASAQHAKMLDRSLRVLGVADRHPVTGHPRVLVTYPLRVMCDDARSKIRGFSTNKWGGKHGTDRALAQHLLAVLPGVHRPGRHPRADRAHPVVPGATQ